MSGRRFLAMLLVSGALLAGLAAAVPVALALAESPYDHAWRIEGLYVGDAGSTRRAVVTDRMTLQLTEGRWRGSIALVDVLGIEEASGFAQSQNASLSLDLAGDPAEGGSSIAGRFVGVAELRTREADSLDDALKPSAGGLLATYDVSGFWAAKLDGDVAEGQLYYQSARRRPGSRGPVRDADWFNRAPLQAIDATGEPQPFVVAVEGVDPSSGGEGGLPDDGDDGSTPGPDAADGAGPQRSGTARPSFLEYVRRGLGGGDLSRPAPVSAAQAAAARALRDAAPKGATALPADAVAVDLDVPGALLDAKNRAAGLLDEGMRPVGAVSSRGRAAVEGLYQRVPGRPAPAEGEDAAIVYAQRLGGLLAGQTALSGANELALQVAEVPAGADVETVVALTSWLSVAEAIAAPVADGSELLDAVERASSVVSEEPMPARGALASGVLAAANDPRAPLDAVDVSRFARRSSFDASSTSAGTGLPNRVLASVTGATGTSPALIWAGGTEAVQPSRWLARERADGSVYWTADEEGAVALTDSTLHGWAWTLERASLVDAAHSGRVIERFRLR